jgi:transposase
LVGLEGASVLGVRFVRDGVVVLVRLRRRRRACSVCGQIVAGRYDTGRRRWRHLDLGGVRCFVEARLSRLRCPDCGVRVEAVPFARAGARHTRAFEELVCALAKELAKTVVTRLLRIGWRTVGRIVARVLSERLSPSRFDGLRRVGIDEISYRRGHRYLTLVLDHDTGRVVWASEGARQKTSLDGFLDALDPSRQDAIEAVSIDMAPGYYQALRKRLPKARLCIDPFHVVKLANRALERQRRTQWRLHSGRKTTARDRWLTGVRWMLLTGAEHHSDRQQTLLNELERKNHDLYRAYLLKEQLRALYQLPDPKQAPALLDAWLEAATESGLSHFQKLATTLARYRTHILAAVELGLSNGRLEGLNSRIRLISHRSYGLHSPTALTALVYLCCGGLEIELPLR